MPWYWRTLGGRATSGPAACTYSGQRIDVFARGQDQRLWSRSFNGRAWDNWAALGGTQTIASDPTAVSWGPDRLDVFARGPNDDLLHLWHAPGGSWSSWESLGGTLASGPSALSVVPGELDVYALAPDGSLQHIAYGRHGWESWRSWGGSGFTSDPAAVAWHREHRRDVFVRGQDNTLYHRWFQLDGGFGDWESLGGSLTSGPAACSLAPGRLDVFSRGQNGGLWHQYYPSAHGWSGWVGMGPKQITSDPEAIASGTAPHLYAVFARGPANDILLYAYQAPPPRSGGGGGSHWYTDPSRVIGDIFSLGLTELPLAGGGGDDSGDGDEQG